MCILYVFTKQVNYPIRLQIPVYYERKYFNWAIMFCVNYWSFYELEYNEKCFRKSKFSRVTSVLNKLILRREHLRKQGDCSMRELC